MKNFIYNCINLAEEDLPDEVAYYFIKALAHLEEVLYTYFRIYVMYNVDGYLPDCDIINPRTFNFAEIAPHDISNQVILTMLETISTLSITLELKYDEHITRYEKELQKLRASTMQPAEYVIDEQTLADYFKEE